MQLEPENPYNLIAYRTWPRPQTHPDRLAAIGRLFGMDTAPVTSCRVLELGCGDASNLIPLAFYLPGSNFTGIDLASAPIEAAAGMARDLGLSNMDLRAIDLREFPAKSVAFDYIIAHGLYSWVPPEVRDALLGLCRRHLAPNGIAFISYNVYPGRYPRQMMREILRYHVRDIELPEDRIAAARDLLREIDHPEARAILDHGDDSLFHDDLAETNDPVWFRDFAAHAASHRLQFLGEADSPRTFEPLPEAKPLSIAALIEREQYSDFHAMRPFRQSLLCRAEVKLNRDIGPARMDEFLFSENKRARRIRESTHEPIIGEEAVDAVIEALHDTAPLPAAFDELVAYAGSAELLRQILFALLGAGCVSLHVHDFPCQETVSACPRTAALVRYQAALGGDVTNAAHIPVRLDPLVRRLVLLLDGTRTREALAEELAEVEGAPPKSEILRRLPESLDWLARMGLLEG